MLQGCPDVCCGSMHIGIMASPNGHVSLLTQQAFCWTQASDELRLGPDGKPHFSAAFEKVIAFQARHPNMALIDPLANLQKVSLVPDSF